MLKSFTIRDKVAFTDQTVLIKKQFVWEEGEEESMIQSPVPTATAKSALFVSYPIRAGDDSKDADMVDCKKKAALQRWAIWVDKPYTFQSVSL